MMRALNTAKRVICSGMLERCLSVLAVGSGARDRSATVDPLGADSLGSGGGVLTSITPE
jgi:hypothetical protein